MKLEYLKEDLKDVIKDHVIGFGIVFGIYLIALFFAIKKLISLVIPEKEEYNYEEDND